MRAPSPTTSGGGSSRSAVERAPSAGGLPSTAPSSIRTPAPIAQPGWITTPAPISMSCGSTTSSPSTRPGARSDCRSTRALLERALERLEHAHHAQAALAPRARLPAVGDALDEMTALDPQRLLVRHVRRPDVARACHVLAVGLVLLVEALVVDGDLALDLHVVERGHLLRAHHREAALLVRVEPGQVQVRSEPGREAQVAEHHVLDPRLHVALAAGLALARLLTPG